MHIRKFLSIFLIGLVFAIAGCSSDSTSGISEEDRLPDTDNDGIVNNHDGDIDGDGKPNQNDDDIDGDGVTNEQDGDDDGDGIPDGGDSTPQGPPSNDIDGDGIPNDKDPDKDGDGIPNDKDPDKDGDGKPNDKDPTPGGDAARTCTSAKIKPPKDGITGVLNTVSWELLPEGCELSATVSSLLTVTASAEGVTTQSDPASLGDLTTNIVLPHDCDWSGTQSITYDFSEIGNALGDTSSNYTAERVTDVGSHPRLCKKPPVLCTSVTFTAPEQAKFNSSYELTWRLSPEGCIPHNGDEKLTPIYFGDVKAPEIDYSEQILLDSGPPWAPLDGKATINVPDARLCSGDYDDDTTSDGKVGVLEFVDKSRCDPFRIGAVGEDGTCDGLRIPELSCP